MNHYNLLHFRHVDLKSKQCACTVCISLSCECLDERYVVIAHERQLYNRAYNVIVRSHLRRITRINAQGRGQ